MPSSVDFFKKYAGKYFIETGSFRGDGIQMAIEAGFEQIISVELFEDNHEHCKNRFKDADNVTLLLGSSSELLYDMVKGIDEPVLFWLDAHYSGSGTAKTNGKFSPIIQEIRQIDKHPIKTHTIMIDDIRDFGTRNFDFVKRKDAVSVIKSINEDYIITFETGNTSRTLFKNDILVAKV